MITAAKGRHLSDVLDLERDIGEHRLIRLSAGVGAGKNGWTIKLANQGYRVLLITSRVATAQAQAEKMGADRWLDFDRLFDEDDFWGELPEDAQRKVVCTNAHIERYAVERYNAADSKTHVWDKFDFIILDEAHSLTADAAFSDAPFHVESFLKHAYRYGTNCRIVIMSGTQEPIDWLFVGEKNQQKVHTLDLFDECIHVEPEQVIFYPEQCVLQKILHQFRQGMRIIYFAVRTQTISRMVKKLIESGVPEECIGVSYSKDERNSLFSEALVKRRDEIRESLTTAEHLPENVRIWITTSQYKEGVNILDEDIPVMYAEHHKRADLVQMAGRVRNGLKYLAVIYDAEQYPSGLSQFREILNREALDSVRSAYREYVNDEGDENGKKAYAIRTVQDMYSLIRYDRFAEEFRLYRGRSQSERQAKHEHEQLTQCIEECNVPLFKYGMTGYEVLQEWFPYSKISIYDKNKLPDAEEAVRLYLEENRYLDVQIGVDSRNKLQKELNAVLLSYPVSVLPEGLKLPFKSLKPVLGKFGYVYESVGKHGTKWVIRRADRSEK